MREDDLDYHEARAEQEIRAAQAATNPNVVAVHYALAELYLERVARKRADSPDARTTEQDGPLNRGS